MKVFGLYEGQDQCLQGVERQNHQDCEDRSSGDDGLRPVEPFVVHGGYLYWNSPYSFLREWLVGLTGMVPR